MGLFSLLLQACGIGPAKRPQSAEAWLKQEFPDRFKVVSTLISDPVANLSFKVKRSVVAETSDTTIQALLSWDKRKEDLGLDRATVDALFRTAAEETTDAKTLGRRVREQGMTACAVGAYEGTLHIILFDTPDIQTRNALLEPVSLALGAFRSERDYAVQVSLFDQRVSPYADYYPVEFWATPGTFVSQRISYFIRIPSVEDAITLHAGDWKINTNSAYFSTQLEQVRAALRNWADQHIKPPVTLSSTLAHEPVEGKPESFRISIGYYPVEEENTDDGAMVETHTFLSCILNTDSGTVSDIRKEEEAPE